MTWQQAKKNIRKGLIFSMLIAVGLLAHILTSMDRKSEQYQVQKVEPQIIIFKSTKVEDVSVVQEIVQSEKAPEFEEWVKPQIYGMVPVYGRSRTDYISLTEFELMSKTVYAEAETESFEGKVAVAEVILNRVESDNFPNTVEAVIKADNAFSSWETGAIEKAPLDDVCMEAVQDALNERVFPGTVVYFREGQYHSFGKPYTVIDNHYFSLEGDEKE